MENTIHAGPLPGASWPPTLGKSPGQKLAILSLGETPENWKPQDAPPAAEHSAEAAERPRIELPKQISAEQLSKLLDAAADARSALASITEFLQQKEAERIKLELSADLSDDAALAKLGRLQVVCSVGASRIAAAEEREGLALDTLLAATEAFIAGTLGPKLRSLLEATTARLATELPATTFPSRSAVDHAIQTSAPVMRIKGLQHRATLRPCDRAQAVQRAREMLEAWSEVKDLKK